MAIIITITTISTTIITTSNHQIIINRISNFLTDNKNRFDINNLKFIFIYL